MCRLCISVFRARARDVKPIPTDVSPLLRPLHGVRAVLFDVYGTLFASASGDVGHSRAAPRREAFRVAIEALGCGSEARAVERARDIYFEEIATEHRRRIEAGAERPEVRIDEIWRRVAERLGCFDGASGRRAAYRAAVEYEAASNPVASMPGAVEALRLSARRCEAIGIVSNAQFFTPCLFEAYLNAPLSSFGFEERYCAWSFRIGESKPSTRIFAPVLDALRANLGIAPGEVLYIGNDMLNDVYTAHKSGCRTVLFAGDKRSLRLREEESDCRGVAPDTIITAWHQLATILPT